MACNVLTIQNPFGSLRNSAVHIAKSKGQTVDFQTAGGPSSHAPILPRCNCGFENHVNGNLPD